MEHMSYGQISGKPQRYPSNVRALLGAMYNVKSYLHAYWDPNILNIPVAHAVGLRGGGLALRA